MKYGETAVAFKKLILALVACLLITGQVLGGDAVPSANGSLLIGNAFAAEQPSSDEQSGKSDQSYSYEQVGLSVLALALLGLIFWWVIIFYHRLELTSYLGRRYQASIFEFELANLMAEVNKRRDEGDLQRDALKELEDQRPKLDPIPDHIVNYISFWRFGDEYDDRTARQSGEGGLGGNRRPGSSSNPFAEEAIHAPQLTALGKNLPDDSPEWPGIRKYQEQFRQYQAQLRDWREKVELLEREKYCSERDKNVCDARELSGLGSQVDFAALRGRGAPFVLNFTALVVIVFVVMVLGILKVLDPEQIGTLLAAIAGYVLGRATSSEGTKEVVIQATAEKRVPEQQVQKPVPEQQVQKPVPEQQVQKDAAGREGSTPLKPKNG